MGSAWPLPPHDDIEYAYLSPGLSSPGYSSARRGNSLAASVPSKQSQQNKHRKLNLEDTGLLCGWERVPQCSSCPPSSEVKPKWQCELLGQEDSARKEQRLEEEGEEGGGRGAGSDDTKF